MPLHICECRNLTNNTFPSAFLSDEDLKKLNQYHRLSKNLLSLTFDHVPASWMQDQYDFPSSELETVFLTNHYS